METLPPDDKFDWFCEKKAQNTLTDLCDLLLQGKNMPKMPESVSYIFNLVRENTLDSVTNLFSLFRQKLVPKSVLDRRARASSEPAPSKPQTFNTEPTVRKRSASEGKIPDDGSVPIYWKLPRVEVTNPHDPPVWPWIQNVYGSGANPVQSCLGKRKSPHMGFDDFQGNVRQKRRQIDRSTPCMFEIVFLDPNLNDYVWKNRMTGEISYN